MIYSKQYNFVFLANQKAASTSLLKALNKFNELNYGVVPRSFLAEQSIPDIKYITQDQGRTLVQYVNEFDESFSIDTSNLYEFIFVRNPYTRLVSLFNFLVSNLRNARQMPQRNTASVAYEKLQTANMDNFLDKYERVVSGLDTNSINYSQMIYFKNPFTTNLRVFKYENLIDDFNTVKQDLGIECDDLLHLNKNHTPSTVEQLLPSQKNRIYELFKEEFETFGYEK